MSEEFIYSSLATEDPSLSDLIEECIAGLPELLNRLAAAIEEGNAQKAQHAAHSLKGASGSYGFQPVAQVAASAEQACRRGDLEAAQRVLPTLRDMLPRLRSAPECTGA